ncbi:MAG: type II 3-dehydroquinate dehydratase [Clostridia bacterium]|nr:type II 3-dehydroquinate dehydratase [Clostridia bacterium]
MKLLIVNGPNLNLLGIREKHIYGEADYETLCRSIRSWAEELGCKAELFQSNHEGAIVDRIQQAYSDGTDGIVINPAAYTHTSIAILDALKAVQLPAAEVHISDVNAREPFRHISYAGMACEAHFIGLGFDGYRRAMEYLCAHIGKANPEA